MHKTILSMAYARGIFREYLLKAHRGPRFRNFHQCSLQGGKRGGKRWGSWIRVVSISF